MATRIDHSGHPHPSTPAARALCRANGGTGSTASPGTSAPKSPKVTSAAKVPPLTAPKVPVVSKEPVASIPRGTRIDLVPKKTPVKKAPVKKAPAKKATPPAPSTPPTVQGIGAVVPEGDGAGLKGSVQKLIHQGKTRSEVMVELSPKFGVARAHSMIDLVMKQYKVPPDMLSRFNSALPAKGTTVSAKKARQVPNAATIKAFEPTATPTQPGVVPGGRVEAPAGPPSAAVKRLEAKTNILSKRMRDRVLRVGAIQETVVGADRLDQDIRVVKQDIIPKGANQNAFAAFTFQNKTITLHRELESRRVPLAHARCTHAKVRGGDDPIETTIAHEMGHAFINTSRFTPDGVRTMMNTVAEALNLSEPVPRVDGGAGMIAAHQKMRDWWKKIGDRKSPDWKKINEGVSAYGATSPDEFLADVWADYTMNPNPSQAIKKIGDVMKGFITKTSKEKGLWR